MITAVVFVALFTAQTPQYSTDSDEQVNADPISAHGVRPAIFAAGLEPLTRIS